MGGGAQNAGMTASEETDVTSAVTEEAVCHCGGMVVTLFGLASVGGSTTFWVPWGH